jgi:NAD(P)H-hydrate epimerase
LFASPDGQILVNPTGTPAMAKGGSGDILTGMIAGFLAQFPKAEAALVIAAAVYLHGLAAQIAAKSEQTLLATDILGALPEAILSLRK